MFESQFRASKHPGSSTRQRNPLSLAASCTYRLSRALVLRFFVCLLPWRPKRWPLRLFPTTRGSSELCVCASSLLSLALCEYTAAGVAWHAGSSYYYLRACAMYNALSVCGLYTCIIIIFCAVKLIMLIHVYTYSVKENNNIKTLLLLSLCTEEL